jgi:hypothetical protein
MSMTHNTSVGRLLQQRWTEACQKCPELGGVQVSWDFGESAHFSSARGFATTKTDGTQFWLTFARKIEQQSQARTDAIIRHEIGHIVDLSGVVALPPHFPLTIERRADAIAEFVWGDPIYYDVHDVQSLEAGVRPRPPHLGL